MRSLMCVRARSRLAFPSDPHDQKHYHNSRPLNVSHSAYISLWRPLHTIYHNKFMSTCLSIYSTIHHLASGHLLFLFAAISLCIHTYLTRLHDSTRVRCASACACTRQTIKQFAHRIRLVWIFVSSHLAWQARTGRRHRRNRSYYTRTHLRDLHASMVYESHPCPLCRSNINAHFN